MEEILVDFLAICIMAEMHQEDTGSTRTLGGQRLKVH